MQVFKDANGKSWNVVVDVGTVKRVRELAKVDLLAIADGTLGDRLAGDPVLLVDTLYATCKPQADAAGVTDEQFGAALVGDVLDAATTALLGEIVDFFPKRQREMLTRLQAKGRAVGEATARLALAKLDALDPEAIARTLIGSAGTSPEPSASTPDP